MKLIPSHRQSRLQSHSTRAFRTFLLLAFLPALAGCVVSIGNPERSSRDEGRKPAPPTVIVASNSEDAAVLAEIDAAAKLSFEQNKVPLLKTVASRPDLPVAAQVHLANTTFRTFSFEANTVDVLQTLIANPAFSPAAKETILRQLDRLSFEPNKTLILQTIQSRQPTS